LCYSFHQAPVSEHALKEALKYSPGYSKLLNHARNHTNGPARPDIILALN
jgi:hypothetical protein